MLKVIKFLLVMTLGIFVRNRTPKNISEAIYTIYCFHCLQKFNVIITDQKNVNCPTCQLQYPIISIED